MNFFFRPSRSRQNPDRMSKRSSDMLKIELSPIFKLNVQCFHKLFECLTLKEVHSVAETCRRFNIICGAYFLRNYTPSAVCVDDGIVAYRHQSHGVTYGYQLNAFCQYIEKLIIPIGSQNQFRYAEENCGEALISIRFEDVIFSEHKIKCIKRLLAKVETVEFIDCKMNIYFYEGFLKYCHQLKKLKLRNFEYKTFINRGNDWMFRKYPLLEHLGMFNEKKILFFFFSHSHPKFKLFSELTKYDSIRRSELEILFELNPNIQSFEIDINLFWENKMMFMEAGIMWNDLIIHFHDAKNPLTSSIYSLLNTFHRIGHFKKLHLHHREILNQPFIDQIKALHALDTLHLKEEAGSSLPILTDLRELYTYCGNLNMEKTVHNLSNLEKVAFWETNIEDVLAIIRNSVRVREIKIRTLKEKGRFSAQFNGKNFFSQNRLNLLALNDERRKILGACKIAIYVSEDIYIATKWTTNEFKHSLIELKRIMLHEWYEFFQE